MGQGIQDKGERTLLYRLLLCESGMLERMEVMIMCEFGLRMKQEEMSQARIFALLGRVRTPEVMERIVSEAEEELGRFRAKKDEARVASR